MVSEFVAYIDEAGDEGFGKLRSPGQSRWLLLGAAIVSKSNDGSTPAWRDDVMRMFPKKKSRDLHFRHISHAQRVAACENLVQRPVGISIVASNKITLLDSPKKDIFKRKGHLYNYLVRFLLERITSVCRTAAGIEGFPEARLHVVFSRRSGTNYQSMRDYLLLMRDGREAYPPVRSIDWGILDPSDIAVQNHSLRAGLQLADVFTSATAAALEPNEYGNTEPRYALSLRPNFIRSDGRVANAGLTILPAPHRNPLPAETRQFLRDMEVKVRAPGS